MSDDAVTVAIPVRNGGPLLADVLARVRAQRLDRPVEIVVLDSGSKDDSVRVAEASGARVERLVPGTFRHGAARNRLMEMAGGAHVAFLTQDALPASEQWLAALLAGFDRARDVALVTGPYVPRADAPVTAARELEQWFAGFGGARVDRGPVRGPSPATFFTSANGAVSVEAWRTVPFRDVPYAEDQRLALDMLAAGYAKAYEPEAAVVHSHAYPPLRQFRRFFDEFRALNEVYGHREPLHPRPVLGRIRREVAMDRAYARARGEDADRLAWSALQYHGARALGAALGTRAGTLPPAVRRWCSLERRASYEPSHAT